MKYVSINFMDLSISKQKMGPTVVNCFPITQSKLGNQKQSLATVHFFNHLIYALLTSNKFNKGKHMHKLT